MASFVPCLVHGLLGLGVLVAAILFWPFTLAAYILELLFDFPTGSFLVAGPALGIVTCFVVSKWESLSSIRLTMPTPVNVFGAVLLLVGLIGYAAMMSALSAI